MSIDIKIINKSKHPLPAYQSEQAAGVDLRASIDKDIALLPLQRELIETGLFIEIPAGYEAQIRPRSGLASKHGITVINTPGTIDSDYRGEIKICLVNLSNEPFIIKDGERIAQMVFAKHETALFTQVSILNETKRGEGGIGSTGK